MTAFTYIKDEWTPVLDDYLAKHLASEVEDQKISQIMSYTVMAGGKRLRPLLFLPTLNDLDRKLEEHGIRIASGIELIHTHTWTHEVMPAMDNDDDQRGKLTSHKEWGEAEAILAGDALLPMGIQWVAQGSKSAKLVDLITKAVGPNGMVGGQYLDID